MDDTLENDAILDESARFALVRVGADFEIRSTDDRDEPLMRLSAVRYGEDQARSAFRQLVRQERLALFLIAVAVSLGTIWVVTHVLLAIPNLISFETPTFNPFGDASEPAVGLRDWLQLIESTTYATFVLTTILYVLLWLQRRWWLERSAA